MTGIISALVAVSAFALSFTSKKVLNLCAFYLSFGVLTVTNAGTTPVLGGFKFYRLIYPFLFLVALSSTLRKSNRGSSWAKQPWLPYISVLVVTIASSFYSPYIRVLSLGDPSGLSAVLLIMSLFWVSFYHIEDNQDLILFGWAVAATSLLLGGWVIWTASQSDFAAFRGGTEVNENYSSAFVVAGVFPLIQFFFTMRNAFAKMLLVAGLFVIAFGAFILASRGTFIAAFLAAVVMGGILLKKVAFKALLLGLVLFILTIGSVMLLPGGANIVAAFQAPEVSGLDDRTMIWEHSLGRFFDASPFRVLLGDGLSSSLAVVPTLGSDYQNYHNVYLMWLMEQGLVGLAVFTVFLCRIGLLACRSDCPSKAMLISWLVFFLALGLSGTISTVHPFWIIVGVVAGGSAFVDRSRPDWMQEPVG